MHMLRYGISSAMDETIIIPVVKVKQVVLPNGTLLDSRADIPHSYHSTLVDQEHVIRGCTY
jgi:hypothetical protein